MTDLIKTNCAICGNAQCVDIYPAKLNYASIGASNFSARISSHNSHYKIVKCTHCGLIRSNPVLPENKANELYRDSNMAYDDALLLLTKTYVDLLNKIPLQKENNRTLLEIGCGSGFFLEAALQIGYKNIVGFEPSTECIDKASPLVKDYIVSDIFMPDKVKEASIDVVAILHTIDHLYFPKKVLIDSLKVLKSGGHILIVCHDANAFTARLLKEKSPIWNVQHIYYFDQKTLRLILEEVGFKNIKVGSLTNIYSLIYWLKTIFRGSKLLDIIPRFIANIPIPLRAGNMYAIAQKP